MSDVSMRKDAKSPHRKRMSSWSVRWARITVNSRPQITAVKNAHQEKINRAHSMGGVTPIRNSMSANVRHTAATIGQTMVIQFTATDALAEPDIPRSWGFLTRHKRSC